MIRNVHYFGFIHRLRASRVEGRARRHDPVLSRHRATAAGAHFDYRPAPAGLVERARQLEAVCAGFGVPLRAAAARFPLRHPAVASVLIGARSPDEIADAIRLRETELPPALWDDLLAPVGS